MVTRRLPPAEDHQPAPSGERIYAVGDIHGHADKLMAMHDAIRRDLRQNPAARPLLIHLGDYIDRGPDSAGCLAILAPTNPLPQVPTINLMGNHEAMLLAALDRLPGPAVRNWLANGGDTSLESWGIPLDTPAAHWADMIPPSHLAFLRNLAFSHVTAGYAFVHAGVQPGVPLSAQNPTDLMWIRDGFLDWKGTMLPEKPGLIIVHGHTPQPEPCIRANRIGIDTGAGKGGPLTCAVLDAAPLRFLQV